MKYLISIMVLILLLGCTKHPLKSAVDLTGSIWEETDKYGNHTVYEFFENGKLVKVPFILNSLLPWISWKLFSKKIDEIEFIDTFRFGIGICVFPIFYLLQTAIVNHFYGPTIAGIYFFATLLIALLYCKFSTTPTE